jgi:hypothetical protein
MSALRKLPFCLWSRMPTSEQSERIARDWRPRKARRTAVAVRDVAAI